MPPAPPASNFERGAADRDIELTVNQPGDNAPVNPNEPELPAGPGAADADSGAGAGAGIPGGGTDMRLAGKPRPGNLQQDRDRVLGPGAGSGAPSRAPDENAEADPNLPGAHVVSDESSFGGPVRIDTDEQKDRR